MKNTETNSQRNQTKNTAQWQQKRLILNSNQRFALLNTFHNSVYLDSGLDDKKGRFDIISSAPLFIHQAEQKKRNNEHFHTSPMDDWKNLTKEYNYTPQTIPNKFITLPFVSGLIGFVSYEYGAQQTIDSAQSFDQVDLPSLYIGEYTWSYVYDKLIRQGYLTFSPRCPADLRSKILKLLEGCAINPNESTTDSIAPSQVSAPEDLNWIKTLSFEEYKKSFDQVKRYIIEGDCYQVNLAQRFETQFHGSPLSLYFNLRKKVDTPYSAFMSFAKNASLLSFSPEQFIGISGGEVQTKPIKGTIENTKNSANALQLSQSFKNKAENLMIVDLLRNDLSKFCEIGSIKVSKLFELETYKNVHHLVSHIKGKLKADINELDAFFSCFPGGSITGAPKKRSMEIINELESSGRTAYCGSIFYLNGNGNFDSNILIRSIIHSNDKLHCWGGGGIVHDSLVEEEYLESITKVANLTGICE